MPTYVIYYNQGNTPGPFDIYLSGSGGLTLYASDVSQYALLNGYVITFPDGIPSSSVAVFDISYGCFTDQNIPWPSVSPSVTPSITRTPSITPSITVSPSITPSVTKTPSVTPSVTPPPSVSPSLTPSSSPNTSPSSTPSVTPTRTPSPTVPIIYNENFYLVSPGANSAYLACYSYINNNNNQNIQIYIATPANIPVVSPLTLGTIVYIRTNPNPVVYSPFQGNNQWYFIDTYISQNIGGEGYFYQITNAGAIIGVSYQNCST